MSRSHLAVDGLVVALIVRTCLSRQHSIIRLSTPLVISDRLIRGMAIVSCFSCFRHHTSCLSCECVSPSIYDALVLRQIGNLAEADKAALKGALQQLFNW